jgi:hypothetical protein
MSTRIYETCPSILYNIEQQTVHQILNTCCEITIIQCVCFVYVPVEQYQSYTGWLTVDHSKVRKSSEHWIKHIVGNKIIT